MKKILFRPSFAALLLALPLLFTSCKKDNDDPEPEDENELITTVRYTLTPATAGGQTVTAEWKDLDGEGGAAPTIGTLRLAPNTTYTGTISFLDETKTPAGDVTAEVREENYEHLVIYTPAPASAMTITRTDRDRNNLEVGLTTNVRTGAAAITGTLQIQLRHQPGVKDGTATPGSDDANITFPIVLQ